VKQDALLLLLFIPFDEYATRKLQANQEEIKLDEHISFWSMPMMLIYW